MLPTAPNLPAGGPGPAPLVEAQSAPPLAVATPPAAPPDLGAKAVTQAEPGGLPPLDTQTLGRLAVPEIPPDPPPVKGLGIPPLDTTVVGDFDEIENPPEPEPGTQPITQPGTQPGEPAMTDLLQALQDRSPPGLDRRA